MTAANPALPHACKSKLNVAQQLTRHAWLLNQAVMQTSGESFISCFRGVNLCLCCFRNVGRKLVGAIIIYGAVAHVIGCHCCLLHFSSKTCSWRSDAMGHLCLCNYVMQGNRLANRLMNLIRQTFKLQRICVKDRQADDPKEVVSDSEIM